MTHEAGTGSISRAKDGGEWAKITQASAITVVPSATLTKKDSGSTDGVARGADVTETGILSQIGPLAHRSVARTLRQPKEYLPAIIFPLVILAVLQGGLRAAAALPGFPTRSYLAFILGAIFVQGAITNGVNSGGALAVDIESGFLRRLALTRVSSIALLAAQLTGALVIGLIQAVVFLGLGLALGVTIETGVVGALLIIVFALLVTVAFGGLGSLLALRTGNAEAVQGIAPALIFLMFFSSMLLPRYIIDLTWFRVGAALNPLSYLIEGLRSLIISDDYGLAIVKFLCVVVGMIVLTIAASTRAFTKRMATS